MDSLGIIGNRQVGDNKIIAHFVNMQHKALEVHSQAERVWLMHKTIHLADECWRLVRRIGAEGVIFS